MYCVCGQFMSSYPLYQFENAMFYSHVLLIETMCRAKVSDNASGQGSAHEIFALNFSWSMHGFLIITRYQYIVVISSN